MLRNRKPINLAGQRFGRLHAIFAQRIEAADAWFWLCRCDCGRAKLVRAQSLRNGDAQSCGCLQRETLANNSAKARIHGDSHSKAPEYYAWRNMIERCENPKRKDYYLYGARGIRVCKRWRHSYLAFLTDMGRKPSPLHTLDRINTNGDYKPSNCRWATKREQMLNRRPYSEWNTSRKN